MQQVRLEHRREQIVRGADRVDVAGEVQVDQVHGRELSPAAAGSAALDPEDRPERGLAETQEGPRADVSECLGERDRGGRLALAGLRRRDRRDGDELAIWRAAQALERGELDLGGPCGRTAESLLEGARAARRARRQAEALAAGWLSWLERCCVSVPTPSGSARNSVRKSHSRLRYARGIDAGLAGEPGDRS